MVKPEKYNLTRDLPRAIIYRQKDAELVQLERAASGAWFVTVNLSIDFHLADGRKVAMNKQVRLRGQQTGTKPSKGGLKRRQDGGKM